MIKLFDLMDNSSSVESDLQVSYSIGNRTIEVINTCEQLENVMNTILLTPFIGFDSEQKPTFKKGQADNGVCLIQLATKEKCYLIQIKQIKNLKPLIDFLEDDKIIKILSKRNWNFPRKMSEPRYNEHIKIYNPLRGTVLCREILCKNRNFCICGKFFLKRPMKITG
mgnify:CR=1 FL=1